MRTNNIRKPFQAIILVISILIGFIAIIPFCLESEASEQTATLSVPKTLKGWISSAEHHQWDYQYDLSKKTISITDRFIDPTGDWGDGYPFDYADDIDGLIWDGFLKDNVLLQLTFNSMEGFNDDILFASHPLIKNGMVTKINVDGVGKITYTYPDVQDEDYYLKKRFNFETSNGKLTHFKEAIELWKGADVSYTDTYYEYDNSGRLVKVKKVDDNDGSKPKLLSIHYTSDTITITTESNGAWADRTWNATIHNNKIAKASFEEMWQTPTPEVSALSFEYDSNNNLTCVKCGVGPYSDSESIQYDGNRLASFAYLYGSGNNTYDYVSYQTVISDNGQSNTNDVFTLGKDNNSFSHSPSTIETSGFFGVGDYGISDTLLRSKLLNMTTSNGEMGKVLDKMYSTWEGSCYGASSVIGLCFMDYLSLDSLSNGIVPNSFYELKRPCDNSKLLDMVQFFQLTQYLKSYGNKSSNVIQTLFNYNGYTLAPKGLMGSYFNSDFYKLLIDAVNNHQLVLLSYYDETHKAGHAILTTGLKRLANGDVEIQIYDLNDISYFDKLIISEKNGKYSARYECPSQPNKNLIDNMAYMGFVPLDSLKNVLPSKSVANNMASKDRMSLSVKLDAPFKLSFSNGTYYSYDGTRITGDANIYNITPIATSDGGYSEVLLETDYSNNFEYVSSGNYDLSAYSTEDYYSVKGDNLDLVDISFDEGITVSGNEVYSFDCATMISGNNPSVCHYQGETNGQLNIKPDNDGRVYIDTEKEVNYSTCSWITENDHYSKTFASEEKISDSTLSFDNGVIHLYPENGTIVSDLNGIAEGPNGKWAMYKDGEVDTSYTGIAQNQFGWWRIKDGYVDFNAQGIYQNQFGWWKTTNGKVTFKEAGVFQNEFGWWRVKDSKVDFKAQGIYQNRYGWWKTTNGKVTFKENGVFQNEFGWWKVKDSKVDFSFTGIASNKFGKWYIKDGKVDFAKNGKVNHNGATYIIKNGKVV